MLEQEVQRHNGHSVEDLVGFSNYKLPSSVFSLFQHGVLWVSDKNELLASSSSLALAETKCRNRSLLCSGNFCIDIDGI